MLPKKLPPSSACFQYFLMMILDMILDKLRNSTPINSTLLLRFRIKQFNIGTATKIKLTLNVKVRNRLKEIKFKIVGQCPYTNRYFVQIIYQKGGVYAKIADLYKSIGAAKEINPTLTTDEWDDDIYHDIIYGDISQNDLKRFIAAEKMKEESDTSMTPSVVTSNSTSTQVIFVQLISLILFYKEISTNYF